MPALKAVHTVDPRREIRRQVGKQIDDMVLYGNAILVAIYVRPKTASYGTLQLQLADKTVDEDKNQGKVGLVLAKGPRAYVDDEYTKFHGQNIKIGDWVVFRPSEGWALTLTENQVACRMLEEMNIRMVIPSPDGVW